MMQTNLNEEQMKKILGFHADPTEYQELYNIIKEDSETKDVINIS